MEDDREYLTDYWRRYWGRVQDAKQFIPAEYLPRFLKFTRLIEICRCSDGYVVFMHGGEGEIRVSCHQTKRRALDVLHSKPYRDAQGRKSRLNVAIELEGAGAVYIAEPYVVHTDRAHFDLKTFYRPPWLAAFVIVGTQPGRVLTRGPEAHAERDVKAFAFALRLEVSPSTNVGETAERVIAKLRDLLGNFVTLLQDAAREEELQDYIRRNPILLSPFSHPKSIYPKYPLGKDYRTDFVIENSQPTPFSHTFVEIEPASEPLFLKGKKETDLTARANHAIGQLMDWRIWVRDNIAYVRRHLPNLDQCNYVLLMGRSVGLTDSGRRKLAEANSEHSWRQILTYDDIVAQMTQLIDNLAQLDDVAQ